MAENSTLEICFICDNGYVMPTAVAITSLIASKRDSTRCNIYVIADELSEQNEEVFKRFCREDVNVRVIRRSADELRTLHAASCGSMCVATPAALLKFFLGDMLVHLDKVLYADGDVIFRRDMLDLYNTALGENLVAAVPDTGIMYSLRPILRAVKTYFNSGIMLLNLNKMRDGRYAEKLVEAKRKSTDASLMDQNIFNLVFDGFVLPLPVKYNCLFVNLVRAYAAGSFRFSLFNKTFSTAHRGFLDLLDDAAVIHYSSKDKPWKVSGTPLCEEWEKMYRLSPFASEPLVRTNSTNGVCSFDYASIAGVERPVIVSLTSFPGRIDKVHVALESILSQTMRPDRIILWLAREEFPGLEESLPESLRSLIPRGVEIGWADRNLGAHKKYCYVLRDNPDAVVITVDDDLISPNDLVLSLYRSYLRFPNCVSALRTHLMTFSPDGELMPYKTWRMTCVDYVNRPNSALFATTGAGVIYPPHVVPQEALAPDIFMRVCPHADDVWMKMMTAAAGIPVVNPSRHRCVLKIVDGTQENALWQNNVLSGGNDQQIATVVEYCDKAMPGETGLLRKIWRDSVAAEIGKGDLASDKPVRADRVPAVSVVLPIENASVFLDKCLSSLLAQTLADIEIICVDDGSTDDPMPILRKYALKDGRVGVFPRMRNGLASTRNEGLALARGKYVVFHDSAASCDRNYLKEMYECAEKFACDVVVCGYQMYNADTGKVEELCCFPKRVVDLPQGFLPEAPFGTFLGDMGNLLGTRLVRREFLKEHGLGFPAVANDDDSFMAMAVLVEASRIGVVNKALYRKAARRAREFLAIADEAPSSIVDAYSALYDRLVSHNLYSRFEACYKRFVITECVNRLTSFTTPVAFRELYGNLRSGGFERLGVADTMPGDVGWPVCRLFKCIVENEDALPFLQEFMLQAQGRFAVLGAYGQEMRRQFGAASTDVRKLKTQVSGLGAEVARWKKETERQRKIAASKPTGTKNAAKDRRVERLSREVLELKHSEAYRLGMFLTWPLRKGWGGIKCLRENGFTYTIKHAVGKVLRLCGSRIKG